MYTVTSAEHKFRKYSSRIGLVIAIALGAYLAQSIHTKQKLLDAAQAKADKEALRTELIVMSSPEATIMCDQNGVIVQSNYATELLLGWPKTELVGQPTSVLIPEAYAKPHLAGMESSLKRIKEHSGNSMILSDDRKMMALRRDGVPVPAVVSVRVIKFMDEVQFIATMRSGDSGDPVIPPQQPVPLPAIPASNVAIERAMIILSDKTDGQIQSDAVNK